MLTGDLSSGSVAVWGEAGQAFGYRAVAAHFVTAPKGPSRKTAASLLMMASSDKRLLT